MPQSLPQPQEAELKPVNPNMEIDFEAGPSGQKLDLLGGGESFQQKNSAKDLEQINQEHEKLISDILVQEEKLIAQHR